MSFEDDEVVGSPDVAKKRTAAGAGFWTISGKLFSRAIDLVTLLVLVRLLPPTDFGLVAMATSVLQIVEAVLELPLAQALIRVPSLTASMFTTALTLGILRGAVIACLMLSLAWPAALFFEEPRLVPLICAMAVAPICRGLISPRMVIYMRRFDFRRDAVLDIVGKAMAFVVAVSTALLTGSYWAIAASTITAPLTATLFSYVFCPMRPGLTLQNWPLFANMLGWNTVSQFIAAANWQTDRFLLGRFIPTSEFGRFSISDTLAALPYQALVDPLTRPLLVAFSSVKDAAELANAYLIYLGVIILLVGPIYAFLAIMAEPAIIVILGETWRSAAPILAMICVVALLQFPMHPLASLLMSQNKTRLLASRYLVESVVHLPASLLGLMYFGITGAIMGRALGILIAAAYTASVVKSICGLSYSRLMRRLGRHLAPIAIASAVTFGLKTQLAEPATILSALTTMIACGALFAASYVGVVVLISRSVADGAELHVVRLVENKLAPLLRRFRTR